MNEDLRDLRLGLWMMLVSVSGLVGIFALAISANECGIIVLLINLISILLLALTGIMGLAHVISTRRTGSKSHGTSDPGACFATARHTLLHERWLIWVLGALALTGVLGSMANHIVWSMSGHGINLPDIAYHYTYNEFMPALVKAFSQSPLIVLMLFMPGMENTMLPGVLALTSLPFVVIGGFLVGGLLGSLRRRSLGGTLELSSFLREAVRYFPAMVAIYALLALLQMVSAGLMYLSAGRIGPWMLNLVSVPLVFAPYAVVAQRLGALAAIRRGVAYSFRHTREVAKFFVVAYSFCAFPIVALATYKQITFPWMPGTLMVIPYQIAGILMRTLLAVAVWEFFWRTSGEEAATAGVQDQPAYAEE